MFGDELNPTTYLADIMGIITDVIAIFMQEPIVYFVVLALVGASVAVVRKLIPTKKK